LQGRNGNYNIMALDIKFIINLLFKKMRSYQKAYMKYFQDR